MHGHVFQPLPYIRFTDEFNPDNEFGSTELKDRLVYRSAKLEHFWSRWKDEYLAMLRERQVKLKRKSSLDIPVVGDVVLVNDDFDPRSSWKLGLILSLLPGEAVQVRAVKVKINDYVCTRAINKLFPLECSISESVVQSPVSVSFPLVNVPDESLVQTPVVNESVSPALSISQKVRT